MSQPIVVIGAGGHAKVVIGALLRSGRTVEGAVDIDSELWGTEILGIPIIGDDSSLRARKPDEVDLVIGIGFLQDCMARRSAFERFRDGGYRFSAVLDPSAVIADGSDLGDGAQAMAGAVIQPGSRIGANAIINTGASVDHDCRVGDHAHIAPGAVLCGGVRVGAGTLIGAGATVIPNITIGPGALVAAGSTVARDIAAGERVAGVPAEPMTAN